MNNCQILLITWLAGGFNIFLIAEKLSAQPTAANPLATEIDSSDSVIPLGYGKRELSSFEIYRIKQKIGRLSQTAKAELENGSADRAFKLWYRQLKLARAIDPQTEITALGDVGAIAWQENRGSDIRNIAARLFTLEQKIASNKPLSANLLNKLATAYQQIRYLDKQAEIQAKIAKISRREDNYSLTVEQKNLETSGKLYLAKFDYENAAKIYQNLLSLTEKEDEANFYLSTLVDIYDRTGQAALAISARKLLLQQYGATAKTDKVAKLQVAIADDYNTLNQTKKAIEAYNSGIKLALQTEQLALASDALSRLGKLYQTSNQSEQAINAYTKLIELQQKSNNQHDSIDTYDALGDVYLKINQPLEALQFFQQGLKLANSLNYKVKYLQQKIEQIDN